MCARRRAEKEKMKRGKNWRTEIKVLKRIRQVEVIYSPLVTHWAPLRYSIVTV